MTPVHGSKLTPSSFHAFLSLGIGMMTARLVHSHQVAVLIATQLLWVLSLLFIAVQARRTGGRFLGDETVLYHGFGIPSYVLGLLLAACFYTVFT